MPASFNGNTAIFGNQYALECYPTIAPLRRQRVTFPGIDGVLDKPLGAQGGRVTVRGILEGTTLAAVLVLEGTWANYQKDAGAYTLVITTGQTWLQAIVATYKRNTDVYIDATGLYNIEYEVEFDLLSV